MSDVLHIVGISSGSSLTKMGNLSVIKQFELKEEALEADIDYFLNENMDHIGFLRVFVVICKLSCLQTLLHKVISKILLLFRFRYCMSV